MVVLVQINLFGREMAATTMLLQVLAMLFLNVLLWKSFIFCGPLSQKTRLGN